jgi:hypothetical protein
MPTPPILTPEQRAAALEKAAYARKARAEVKERLKMGILTLPNLFKEAEETPILVKIKVSAVIESLPGVGKVKAKRIMEELEIAPSRRLGGLGTKQKAALLNKFSSQ